MNIINKIANLLFKNSGDTSAPTKTLNNVNLSNYISVKSIAVEPNNENKKEYIDVTAAIKQATIINNSDGFDAAIEFYISFLDSNEINFNGLLRCFKMLIGYLRDSTNYSEIEILNLCDKYFNNFPEFNELRMASDVSNIYERFDIHYAIKYLKSKINYQIKDETNYEYYAIYFKLGAKYIEIKDANNAIINTMCAQTIAFNTQKGMYLCWDLIKILNQMAIICLDAFSAPHYKDYIQFRLKEFVMTILGYIKGDGNLVIFMENKENCMKGVGKLNDDFTIIKALKGVNKDSGYTLMLKELYEYTFFQLLIDSKFPEVFLDEKELEILNSTDWPNDRRSELFIIQSQNVNNNYGIVESISFVEKLCERYLV